MQADLRDALAARLLAMADDELILGHRDSEWCGHAPILEEDIAFANLALDELGHAILWYQLVAELRDKSVETFPDELAYQRPAADFRHVRMVELPKGDWAFTLVRQYLFDVYEAVMLEKMAESQYDPLAGAAAKIRKEEIYHQRHSSAWVHRLGLGTTESHQRMQIALDKLWPEALALFYPLAGDELLAESWTMPRLSDAQAIWEGRVRPWLTDSGLVVPGGIPPVGLRGQHTDHLEALLNDLQEVTRLFPDNQW